MRTVSDWVRKIEEEDQELQRQHGYDKLRFNGPKVPEAFRNAFGEEANSDSDDHDGSNDSSSANWDGGGWW